MINIFVHFISISVVAVVFINIIIVVVPVIPITATSAAVTATNNIMYRTNTCSGKICFIPKNRIDTSSTTTTTYVNTKRQRPAFVLPLSSSLSSTQYYNNNHHYYHDNKLFAFTTVSRSGFLVQKNEQKQEIEQVTRYQFPFLSLQSSTSASSASRNTNQRLFSSTKNNNFNDNNQSESNSGNNIEDNSDNDDEMEYETDDEDDNDNGATIQQGVKPQSISSYLEQSKNVPNNQQGQQATPKKVVPSGPWTVPETIKIPESRLEFSYVRSSGAGGQNVNKVNTQVQIRFKVYEANWIPEEVRDRIILNNKNIINKDGYLYVSSQEFRTQKDNKNNALYKIETIILKAYPRPNIRLVPKVGLSDISKLRRKNIKQHRKQIKQHRSGNNVKLGKYDFE